MTREENETLTRVGAGTPMGDLLRRYWWPVGMSADAKDKPTFVRLLGEDFVLFRDGEGRPGVLGAYCSHRRANLCLGDVEAAGLRCRYHGWLYDVEGRVLQTPGEPAESGLTDSIRHPSYPVEELGGLVFTYLGPQPVPLLPRFDFLAGDGEHYAIIQGFANCNWLQCVENGLDPFHVSFLHGSGGSWSDLNAEPEMGFRETEYGLVYKSFRPTSKEGVYNYREHYLLMPGISSGGAGGRLLEDGSGTPQTSARWSVPIDDTHTMQVRVRFKPADNPGRYKGTPLTPDWKPVPIEPYREYRESDNPTLGYPIPRIPVTEDAILLDSLPAIADRENEHLSVIDEGVVRVRDMYFEAMETLKAGRDPKGVIRDPAENRLLVIPGYERWVSEAERRQMAEGA